MLIASCSLHKIHNTKRRLAKYFLCSIIPSDLTSVSLKKSRSPECGPAGVQIGSPDWGSRWMGPRFVTTPQRPNGRLGRFYEGVKKEIHSGMQQENILEGQKSKHTSVIVSL